MIDVWDRLALAVILGFIGRLPVVLAMITVYFAARVFRALRD